MVFCLSSDIDRIEELRFRNKHKKEWKKIKELTHFTYLEIECLMIIFYKMQKREVKVPAYNLISRSNFRDVLYTGLGIIDTNLMERVMIVLNKGTSPYITWTTFAEIMSIYPRGTLDEKIEYTFQCYDIFHEGFLRRSTMYHLLKKSMSHQWEEDNVATVKDLTMTLMMRMDLDCDGVIHYQNFRQTIKKNPGLLQCLGFCLPKREAVHTFLATWNPNWPKL